MKEHENPFIMSVLETAKVIYPENEKTLNSMSNGGSGKPATLSVKLKKTSRAGNTA